MKCKSINLVLIIILFKSAIILSQEKEVYKLPSGPDGPGEFGAYYTDLKYDPAWDKNWRVSDHPDVVVRFEDGGHKFVFWRGTSYIPCWVTKNGIWYTNEFVERRGIHSPNTEGCVEPMSDKQCRYSHVRIIESNEARVVVHWRYAPIDVNYKHPFIDQTTGWFDWVDEYYVIYPNAKGVREITAQSGNINKWMEFQEGIVVNQPGTLPHDNIEIGAVSVANIEGSHKTYYWDENGGPPFNDNPANANIVLVNLRSDQKPFAIVKPPSKGKNLITSYQGRADNSIFNWWDHWPVTQEAFDGRATEDINLPSHSSLFHIALQIDPPVDAWGSYGYKTEINNGKLEWTSTEWSGLNLMFDQPRDLSKPIRISFDYANLWTPNFTITFFDTHANSTNPISFNELEEKLVLNDPNTKTFHQEIDLSEYSEDIDLTDISEVYLEIEGSKVPQLFSIDNIRFESRTNSKLDYLLDFNLPDGSLIENINLPDKAEWEPFNKEENKITKIMLHGMTNEEVQDLVPLTNSWINPPTLELHDDGFQNLGYDPTQMAYVVKSKTDKEQSIEMNFQATKDSPLITPAFVIKNWNHKAIELFVNNKKLTFGEDYKADIEKRIDSNDLILWVNRNYEESVSIRVNKIK